MGILSNDQGAFGISATPKICQSNATPTPHLGPYLQLSPTVGRLTQFCKFGPIMPFDVFTDIYAPPS